MAKNVKVDTSSSTDISLEKEAVTSRISGYKTKSTRGPRTAKISVSIPQSLFDELKAIAAATGRPTNDIINHYLEEYAEENHEIGEQYTRLMNRLGE